MEDLQSALEKLTNIKIGWDTPMDGFSAAEIATWLEQTRQISVKIHDINYDLWNAVVNMVMMAKILERKKGSFDWSMSPRQFTQLGDEDE